jgi:hypothetical protein
VIEQLRLYGGAGAILWSYRTVAELGPWQIVRAVAPIRPLPGTKAKADPRGWRLQAYVRRADTFELTQWRELRFAAPRVGGYWYWPLTAAPEILGGFLRVTLGKPLQ